MLIHKATPTVKVNDAFAQIKGFKTIMEKPEKTMSMGLDGEQLEKKK